MIKLRVDWHRKCPDCGTEVVVDFLDESAIDVRCPWCGQACESEKDKNSAELRDFLAKSISELEKKANDSQKAAC